MLETQLSHEDQRSFVLAGKAIFTIVSRATQNRFTYRIKQSKDKQVFFVGLLNGPENTIHYSYIGFIRADSPDVFVHGGMKAYVGNSAPSVKAFDWFWRNVIWSNKGALVEMYHVGKCGRCGRALTVPESIKAGIGPECIKKSY